ncbi:glycosyltransferase family 2 protein [Pinibacter aurantiacus]|uniref:Glycosyltransferase n=1 Tax=Pinibacter aurantiacus TaxID=2851599 RepID=A0A9E2S7V4_9BACT|nr:glycosyltransferase [Pinibacter aurantiacus]MBV4357846.1 glycosyltransferase [Pinibacter aurantiacus]
MERSVSVIIPNYNCEEWVEKAIKSCTAQRPFVKEIIVVDDHSTDQSLSVLNRLQNEIEELVVVKNIAKGGNNARNYGFSLSTGQYIQWLDADDTILPGKFNTQIAYLEKHPKIEIAYSDWKLDEYDENGRFLLQEFKKLTSYSNYLEELLRDNWSPPHSYLVKRATAELMVEKDGWNPSTKIAQDREYFTKAALSGKAFGYVEGVFSIYNRRRQTKSVSRALNNKERAGHVIQLLKHFIDDVNDADWIASADKKRYKSLLMTQILYYSSVYNISIEGAEFSFANTHWRLIKGYRSKLKVILRLLVK